MSTILLGVTGGIAAYKIPALCREYFKAGHQVRVILTPAATRFVSPLTLEYLTGARVAMDELSAPAEPEKIDHIALADWADVFVIAPATANTIAKLATGIADNLLTSLALVWRGPMLVVPAMNSNMLAHPATRANLQTLAGRGAAVMDPAYGELACGVEGPGKMPEPSDIYHTTMKLLGTKNQAGELDMSGMRVLVTAGPTRESIDPVRYISNHSSGKMGIGIAMAAKDAGADVTLVLGPVAQCPAGFDVVNVESAAQMHQAVQERIEATDILVMAAAVADYASAAISDQKMKKSDDELVLNLVKTPDILKELSGKKRAGQVFVGFAAESENLLENASKKLDEKNLDMIVANDISRTDIGFNSDDNEVTIIDQHGQPEVISRRPKTAVAVEILGRAMALFGGKGRP